MKTKLLRKTIIISLLSGSFGITNISKAQEKENDNLESDQMDLKIDQLEEFEFKTEPEGEKEILNDESVLRITDSNIIDSGQLENGEWRFDSDGGLAIQGALRPEDKSQWEKYADRITSIDFYSVNFYGSFLGFFTSYTNLKSVDFMNSNLEGMTSMYGAFSELKNLNNVSFRDVRHSTSLLESTSAMFSGCSGLTDLDLSGLNTSKVKNMRLMFGGCSGLAALDLSDFNTSEVTNMERMFDGCSGLTALDLSGFNTSEVWNMGFMFSGCSGLTALDLSGFNTSEVTDMIGMFSGCSGLAALDLSGFNTSEVRDMNDMFSGCSGLTALNLSGFNTRKVWRMSGMFSECSGLTALDLSDFNTSEVWNMNNMFSRCSELTALDLSGFDTSKVNDMSYMFNGCGELTALDLSSFNTSGVVAMNRMFNSCGSLEKLDISGFDTSKVTDMTSIFLSCYGLSEVSISNTFKFGKSVGLVFPWMHGWQEENHKQIFINSNEMMAYHNNSNETNTYRKVAFVELTMNAKGGKFEDETEKNIQLKVVDELWEEQIPTKENYQFDGWYLDEEYTREFDFSKPATESLTIFAKWLEYYTVTIPATINLNSEEKISISGINNGSGTLKVNLKGTESQINDFNQLRLINKQNADVTAYTTLSWERLSSDIWNVLTVEPEASSVSKSADIGLIKPENAQAGDYEGQMVFSIRYE